MPLKKRRAAEVYGERTSNNQCASQKNATQESGENLYWSVAFFLWREYRLIPSFLNCMNPENVIGNLTLQLKCLQT